MCALSQSHRVTEIITKKTSLRTCWRPQSSLDRVLQCRVRIWCWSLGSFFFSELIFLFNLWFNLLLATCSFREDPKPDLADPFHNTFNFELTPFSIFKRGVTMGLKCMYFLAPDYLSKIWILDLLLTRGVHVSAGIYTVLNAIVISRLSFVDLY